MSKRPNIVLFNPDQWRGDVVGHMGNSAVSTPRIDSLVEDDAVSFRNAFCQNPVCTPSRCSIMTGWYPHVRGHRTMHHMLRQDEPCLLKTMKDAGYYTWWGGKNDLTPGTTSFEPYCNIRFKPTENVAAIWGNGSGGHGDIAPPDYSFYRGCLPHTAGYEHYHDRDWADVFGAVEFIRKYDRDEPFLLYLALTYPHPPYAVEKPWYGTTDHAALPKRVRLSSGGEGKPSIINGIRERQGLTTWSEDRWNELRATYYDMCARVDYQLGLIVDALKVRGFYDNTALFGFSDHGDFTGDYDLVEKTQNTFEDCLTRVPLVIKPPQQFKCKPGIRDVLVELVDISATVYDFAGIDPNFTHFGKSLRKIVASERHTHRDAVFCEGGRIFGELHAAEDRMGEGTNGSRTPTSDPYWPRLSLEGLDEQPFHTKAVMCRTNEYKYVRRFYERDEFYDLRRDPHETVNRIDCPEYAGEIGKHKERMLTWFIETCDVVPWALDPR